MPTPITQQLITDELKRVLKKAGMLIEPGTNNVMIVKKEGFEGEEWMIEECIVQTEKQIWTPITDPWTQGPRTKTTQYYNIDVASVTHDREKLTIRQFYCAWQREDIVWEVSRDTRRGEARGLDWYAIDPTIGKCLEVMWMAKGQGPVKQKIGRLKATWNQETEGQPERDGL